MSRNMRNWMYVLFAVLIMCITLGYAYLNTELEINGTTNITSANWNIYWDNIVFGSNNVTDVTTPATISQGLTEVTFNVNFSQPGDTYEFTVDAVNDGSIDAMISVVSNGVYASNGTTPKNLPDYLEYTVTYSDGITIAQNDLLEAGDTETYKIRVHYKEDITSSQLPSTNDNYMFKFSVTYVQATSSASPVNHPITVYTSNRYNLQYGWKVQIGQAMPNTVTQYQTANDAINDYREWSEGIGNFFLKHIVKNNIVEESYVGFIVNSEMVQDNPEMTEGTYYLKGGVNESWSEEKPIYESNKATLLSAFGSSNCNGTQELECSVVENWSGLYARVSPNGGVYVDLNYAWFCQVDQNQDSYCGVN